MGSTHFDLEEILPQHLAERTRSVGQVREPRVGSFVLYWLHHGMRAHENPALDVAIAIANHLQLPVLVYQAIAEQHP